MNKKVTKEKKEERELLTPEIIEARKKMEEKFGSLKLGGKGTQKRKKIVVHKVAVVQDKKLAAAAKKLNAKSIGEIAELNCFRDDATILHFKKPKVEYGYKDKVTFVTGVAEEKQIKDMLQNIMKQLGPKQYSYIKDYPEQFKNQEKGKEEVPDLVPDFEEVSKQ